MTTMFLAFITISSILAIYCRYKKEKFYPFAKPMPLVFMVCFLFFNMYSTDKMTSFHFCIILGLVFGLFGDLFLLKEKFFLFGLASFLVGHVFYVVGFILNVTEFHQTVFGVSLFFSLLYSTYLSVNIIENKKDKYLLPVFIYGITISLMAASGLNFDQFFNSKFPYISIGALLFTFSDSVWSFNKFVKPFTSAQFFILTSYYAAQGFFCLAIFSVNP